MVILDFEGSAVLQVVKECPLRCETGIIDNKLTQYEQLQQKIHNNDIYSNNNYYNKRTSK